MDVERETMVAQGIPSESRFNTSASVRCPVRSLPVEMGLKVQRVAPLPSSGLAPHFQPWPWSWRPDNTSKTRMGCQSNNNGTQVLLCMAFGSVYVQKLKVFFYFGPQRPLAQVDLR